MSVAHSAFKRWLAAESWTRVDKSEVKRLKAAVVKIHDSQEEQLRFMRW